MAIAKWLDQAAMTFAYDVVKDDDPLNIYRDGYMYKRAQRR